jgi:hypothetical protein
LRLGEHHRMRSGYYEIEEAARFLRSLSGRRAAGSFTGQPSWSEAKSLSQQRNLYRWV